MTLFFLIRSIYIHPDSVSLLDNPTNAEIEEEKAES